MCRLSIFILLIFSGASFAATFDGIDINGDGDISKSELVQSGTFADWDNDNDGRLDANELAIPWAEIRHWDLNSDGYVDEDEFYSSAWNEWDRNGDGHIEEGEFAAANKRWPL